ncbi:MAG: hypothetical protein ACREIM_00080 [Nitrospiraceae bacterium]
MLPVGVGDAQSATGYTGFGPGEYRLRAQVTSPKPLAWSNWVEFRVLTPASKGTIQSGIRR